MRRLKFRREDGVAMTEFALILPIFMVIVAGMLGFGRVFFYWIQANHVANETARWAIVDRNPYAADARCRRPLLSSTEQLARVQTRIRRSASRARGPEPGGAPLKVTVAKPFTFVPDPRHRQDHDPASSTMRIETPRRPQRRPYRIRTHSESYTEGVRNMSGRCRDNERVRSSSSAPS